MDVTVAVFVVGGVIVPWDWNGQCVVITMAIHVFKYVEGPWGYLHLIRAFLMCSSSLCSS